MALTINTNIKNDADGYLIDAKNVKGTYVVVDTVEDLDNLPEATIIRGSLAFVTNTNKLYIYDYSDSWIEIGPFSKELVAANISSTFDISNAYTFTIDYLPYSDWLDLPRFVAIHFTNMSIIFTGGKIEQTALNSQILFYYQNKQYVATLNIDLTSQSNNATLSFQELQAGSGGGGSGETKKWYKWELAETGGTQQQTLVAWCSESKMSDIIDVVNQNMSTNISTPQELITLYNSLRNEDFSQTPQLQEVFGLLVAMFCEVVSDSMLNSKQAYFLEGDDGAIFYPTVTTNNEYGGLSPICKTDDFNWFNIDNTTQNQIRFSTSSTLTITEETETIGGGSGESGDGLIGYQFSFSFDTGDLDLGTATVDTYATNDAFDKISERVNANITFADAQAICDKFNNDYTSLTQQENAILVAILFFLPFVSRTLTHEFGSEPVTAVDVNSSTGAITVNSFSSNGNTHTITTNLSAITLGIKELKTIGGSGEGSGNKIYTYKLQWQGTNGDNFLIFSINENEIPDNYKQYIHADNLVSDWQSTGSSGSPYFKTLMIQMLDALSCNKYLHESETDIDGRDRNVTSINVASYNDTTAIILSYTQGSLNDSNLSTTGNTYCLAVDFDTFLGATMTYIGCVGGGSSSGGSTSTSRTLYHIEVADSNNNKAIIPIYKEAFDKYLVEMNQVGQQMATAMSVTWTTLNTIDDVKDLFDTQKSTQLAYGCDLAMNLLVKYAYESGENPTLSGAIVSGINVSTAVNVIVNYDLQNSFLGAIVSYAYDSDSTSETVQVTYSNGSPVNSNGEETDGSVDINRTMGVTETIWFKNAPENTGFVNIDSNATFTYTEEQISGGGSSGEGGSVELKSNVYTLKFSSNNTYEYVDSNEETQTTELPMIWGITFEAKDIVNRFNAIIDEFNSTSGTSIAHITSENEIATTIKQMITMMIAGNMNNIRFGALFSKMLVYLANGKEQTSDELYANSLNKLYRMFGTTCGWQENPSSPLENNFLANVPIIIMYGMLGGLIDYNNASRELVPLDIESTGNYKYFCLKDTYELELINETPFEATGSGSGSTEPVSGGSGKLYELSMELTRYDENGDSVDWIFGTMPMQTDALKLVFNIYESNFEKIKSVLSSLNIIVNTIQDFVSYINNTLNETIADETSSGAKVYQLLTLIELADKCYISTNFGTNNFLIEVLGNGVSVAVPVITIKDYNSLVSAPLSFSNGNDDLYYALNVHNSCTLTEYGTSGSGSGGEGTTQTKTIYEFTLKTSTDGNAIGTDNYNEMYVEISEEKYQEYLTELNALGRALDPNWQDIHTADEAVARIQQALQNVSETITLLIASFSLLVNYSLKENRNPYANLYYTVGSSYAPYTSYAIAVATTALNTTSLQVIGGSYTNNSTWWFDIDNMYPKTMLQLSSNSTVSYTTRQEVIGGGSSSGEGTIESNIIDIAFTSTNQETDDSQPTLHLYMFKSDFESLLANHSVTQEQLVSQFNNLSGVEQIYTIISYFGAFFGIAKTIYQAVENGNGINFRQAIRLQQFVNFDENDNPISWDLMVSYINGIDTGNDFVKYAESTLIKGSNATQLPTPYDYPCVLSIQPLELVTGSSSGSDSTPSIIETTYADFVSAVTNSTLTPGSKYRITDFVTTCNGVYDLTLIGQSGAYLPYATSAEHQFDLIVEAVGTNKYDENVKATLHSGDTYFAHNNLNAWELKWTHLNDPTKYSWADATNGKGVIYYMRDEFNNIAYYDFKNIMNLQFGLTRVDTTIDTNAAFDYSTNNGFRYGGLFDVFDVLQSRALKSNLKLMTQFFNGINAINLLVFISDVRKSILDSTMNWTYMLGGLSQMMGTTVTLATLAQLLGTTEQALSAMTERQVIEQFFNGKFYYTFDCEGQDLSNYIDNNDNIATVGGGYCHDNNLGHCSDALTNALSMDGQSVVVIPNGLNVMTFEASFSALNCFGNEFGTNCFLNVFGNDCYSNKTKDYFYANKIANKCYNNSFGNYCQDNSFGNECYSNLFGNYCPSNSFGNICQNNSFGNDFESNSFGNGCHSNSFGNSCSSNSFGDGCHSNSFGIGCTSNSFGDGCHSNSFGNYCYSNSFEESCSFNSFGNNCQNNSFGNDFESNSFGNNCESNSFGNDCTSNSFGNGCYSNSFVGNNCYSNSFGNGCYNNRFYGNDCRYNLFENYCYSNLLGDTCCYNAFGNYCNNNKLGNGEVNNQVHDYIYYNIFEDGVSFVELTTSGTGSSNNLLKNVKICQGVHGTSATNRKVITATRNLDYQVSYKANNSTEVILDD